MYMGAGLRPESSEVPECLVQPYSCELTAEPTISIVDNVQHEDEEDDYEEMEEEDGDNEAIPFHEVSHFADRREVEPADQCEPFTTSPPHCLVCGRTRTPKIRLFKWPDGVLLRRSWLAFFHLDLDALEHCKVPYICNIHFDANQFLYEGNRIFWKRDPHPRYRKRRSVLAEPFPWELEQNFEEKLFQQPSENFRCPRLKHGAIHDHLVTFRESYYKSKTKSSHPVAVVSLPENPNVFYEFSYTRTSSIDSSKFYSCLTCRRAKTDTRVKDVIRTIHIKDGAIQSRGDPFWGHHFACRPFTSLVLPNSGRDNSLMEFEENNAAEAKEEFSSHTEDAVHFERNNSLDPNRFIEGIPGTSGIPSTRITRDERRPRSIPQCHLCHRVLQSTHLLVQHLIRHIKSSPTCGRCGSKISPDEHVRLRRNRTCSSCCRLA